MDADVLGEVGAVGEALRAVGTLERLRLSQLSLAVELDTFQLPTYSF